MKGEIVLGDLGASTESDGFTEEAGHKAPTINTVVYTAIFGDYDAGQPAPKARRERPAFVKFSDSLMPAKGWALRIRHPQRGGSPHLSNRSMKAIIPDELSDFEASCYVDGNVRVGARISHLFRIFLESEADFGLFPHGDRGSILEEVAACVEVGKVDRERAFEQLKWYRDSGHVDDILFDGSVIFRRHKVGLHREFGATWFSEIKRWNTRDQLSLPYALRVSDSKVHVFEGTPRRLPEFFRYYHHKGESVQTSVKAKAWLIRNVPGILSWRGQQ